MQLVFRKLSRILGLMVAFSTGQTVAKPAGDSALLAKTELNIPSLSVENILINGRLPEIKVGDDSAPIKIITYMSFTCSHCQDFHQSVFPKLKEKYIDSKKVQFNLQDYPLDGTAFQASLAAWSQGALRYEENCRKLFATAREWSSEKDPLPKIAQILGADLEALKKFVENEKLIDVVAAKILKAKDQYKIEGTPTFIVAGKVYPTALSLDDLEKLIDSPTAEAKPLNVTLNNIVEVKG